MRYAVTGAAGFIGSHLAEALLAAGHDVAGIDSFTDYYDPALKEENARGLAARGRGKEGGPGGPPGGRVRGAAARPRRRRARLRAVRRRLPPRGPARRAQLR